MLNLQFKICFTCSLIFHSHISIDMLSYINGYVHKYKIVLQLKQQFNCSSQLVPVLNFENQLQQQVACCHLLMLVVYFKRVFFLSSPLVLSYFAVFNSTRLWWATPRAMCAQCVGEPWVRLARLDGIFSSTLRTASPTALSVAHTSQTPTTLTGSAHLYRSLVSVLQLYID